LRFARNWPYGLVTSELTIAEVLAPASTPGSLSPEKKFEIYQTILIWSDFIQLVPVTRTILLETVPIRANRRQKLPDAIHAATALAAKCLYYCSSDRDSRRLPPALTAVTPDAAGVSLLLTALKT
jgi:predicted nucleic acid-binding protein